MPENYRDRDSGDNFEADSSILSEEEENVKEPKLYKVLLHNDNYTTMDFVVQILVNIFHKHYVEAFYIMLNVHHNGIGVAGLYTHEVAETKIIQVRELAQQNEFPLRCSMEPV